MNVNNTRLTVQLLRLNTIINTDALLPKFLLSYKKADKSAAGSNVWTIEATDTIDVNHV